MRRSVLFFTFVLALLGCGSDADPVEQPGAEQNPSDPVATPARPPASDEVNDIARLDDGSKDGAFTMTPFDDAVVQGSSTARCLSQPICMERGYRRHAAQP